MKQFLCEIIRDFDYTYHAKVMLNGEPVKGLPEHVNYNQLREAIRLETGVQIPLCKQLQFYRLGRKEYSYINNYIEGPCTGMMKGDNLKDGPCVAVCANGKKFEAVKTKDNIYFTIPDQPGYEIIGYLQDAKKPLLSDQIQAAADKVSAQSHDNAIIFLFEEDRSGDRMGKPGDPNNVYHAKWFEFYTLGADGKPQHENTSLNFTSGGLPVTGGNNISEVDAIEAFRAEHPNQSVVLLSVEHSQKDLSARMAEAMHKYETNRESLVVLPPKSQQVKHAEPSR